MDEHDPDEPVAPASGQMPVEGFALLERDAVRRSVPGFDWTQFAEPSPRNRLTKDLRAARVALVATAGVRTLGDSPFDTISDAGDPSYRIIPSDIDIEQLAFDHGGYDVRIAYTDPDCVFPLRLLRQYVDEGRVGGLAPSAFGLMGYMTQTDVVLRETGPAIADAMIREQVDLALLVPA